MIGDLISAGGRLIGGFLDRDTANKNRDQEMRIAQQNMAQQREFAQQGIRWKVEDAKAAGVHPLYALGANTTSFSPVSISGGSSSNWSDTLGNMGQDVSRAMQATRTGQERVDAFTRSAQALDLEGKKLDNDIKRASLASSVAKLRDNANPPMPGFVPEAKEFEERPRLMASGRAIDTDPLSTNAEDFEKRYGDIAQEIAGVHNMYRDYLRTSGGMTIRQLLERGGLHPADKFLYGDKPWLVPGGWADRVYRRFTGRHSSGW